MKVLHVSEFIEIVNGILRETLSGEVFAIEGEVSGYRLSQGQWVSFDLKDEKGLLNIFMPVWNLTVPVEDGMKIRVFGMPRVYPKYGKFSISAERIELAGEGALKKALQLLRARLEKEGLFDPSRKRELPRFPTRIALVASRESAAYTDFIRILSERWGGLSIDLYHVLVQGEKAPQEIVRAITQAQEGEYDALIMTRGGGSLEELMSFNDERVVRAIHASRIPTLVAIGHERDITLAEEAADVRGSTPTDCARRLVPDRKDIQYEIVSMVNSIAALVTAGLKGDQLVIERTIAAASSWISHLMHRLESQRRLLASLDPKAVLHRGYAILKDRKGRSLSTVQALSIGQELTAIIRDGEAEMRVERLV